MQERLTADLQSIPYKTKKTPRRGTNHGGAFLFKLCKDQSLDIFEELLQPVEERGLLG
ncbi:MAG: hypothetical protein ACJAWL_002615 [Motiliproteus sp.]|jgi:hypothetical protein